MQVAMLLAVPVGLALGTLAFLLPGALVHVQKRDAPFMLIAIVVVLPLGYWASNRFNHYRSKPEAAEKFRAPNERIKSMVSFVLFPILSVAAFGLLVYLLRG